MYNADIEPQLIPSGFTQTPPDMALPITPVLPTMLQMNHFAPAQAFAYDYDQDVLLPSDTSPTHMLDFDSTILQADYFHSSPPPMHDHKGHFYLDTAMNMQTYAQMQAQMQSGYEPYGAHPGYESGPSQIQYAPYSGESSSSGRPTTSDYQESESVQDVHSAWSSFHSDHQLAYTGPLIRRCNSCGSTVV
jgi:hypothetical protein